MCSSDLFSHSGRELVQRHADRYAVALAAEQRRLKAADKPTKDAAPKVDPIPASEVLLLVNEINGVIAAAPFFKMGDLDDVNVENEARRLARRRSELTVTQTQRMNRLVLEGLHRKSMKKLYIAGWRPLRILYGDRKSVV